MSTRVCVGDKVFPIRNLYSAECKTEQFIKNKPYTVIEVSENIKKYSDYIFILTDEKGISICFSNVNLDKQHKYHLFETLKDNRLSKIKSILD